jgi:hypothetical protein
VADVKFQRRPQSPWPWIVGAIILAGFIWLLLMYIYTPNNNKNQITARKGTYSKYQYKAPADTTNEVKEFIKFSKGTSQSINTKNYTEMGIIKLQSALSYIADRINSSDDIVKKNIDTLDRTVAKIDTSSQKFLDELKPAFSAAVKTIGSIQTLNYPKLNDRVSDLKNTERSINERRSVSSQLRKIRQFFSEAGKTLQQMKLS